MAGLDLRANEDLVRARLADAVSTLSALNASDAIPRTVQVAETIVAALEAGGKVLFCGNGGSSMDSGHLAAELMGRFYRDRPSLAAISLADATATMTAVGNDYAYDEVFARQVRGLGRVGDVLVCLTTSGNSANVVKAIQAGRELGITTIALTGSKGGRVAELADICIRVGTDDTPRVQEACLHLGHSICELVENRMFPVGDG